MPNPTQQDNSYKWVTQRDFTPGIVTRTGALASSGSAPSSPGAATLTNTYRCVALPNGGLAPLPSRVFNRSIGAQNAGNNVITGATIVGPVIEGALQTQPDVTVYHRDLTIHQAYAFTGVGGLSTAATPVPSGNWKVNAHILDTSSSRDIETLTAGNPHYSITEMMPISLYISTTQSYYRGMAYNWVKILNTSTANAQGEVNIVPPTTSITADTYQTLNLGGSYLFTLHQDRLVVTTILPSQFGATNPQGFMSTGVIPSNSALDFTLPDLPSKDTAAPLVPDTGNYSGIGCMSSLTASDLLIIYNSGGASLIQGDLAAPVIRRLPNVPGTRGIFVEGASTPQGFIYIQNRGGAYIWAGGDAAQLISPQLDDDFWFISGTEVVQQYAGSCAYWRDYVLLPNNWLYDTKTQSWWKLEDNATLTYWIYRINPTNNMLYAFVPIFTQNATNISGFSPATLASTYSWQSQPFYPAEDGTVEMMELLVIAQGTIGDTLTFTLTAIDSAQVDTQVVTLTATTPTYYRRNLTGATGAVWQVRVQASSVGNAPVLYEYRLGYEDSYKVAAP